MTSAEERKRAWRRARDGREKKRLSQRERDGFLERDREKEGVLPLGLARA